MSVFILTIVAEDVQRILFVLTRTAACICLCVFCYLPDGEKVSDYEMKLMDLDTEHLGIPVCQFMCNWRFIVKSQNDPDKSGPD